MNENLETKVEKLKPFTRILMTIGELPTSYLMSMTYYEQIIWFTKYLQEQVIPAVNNNATAVEEVQTLITDLKNYVDNYFDSLDVQEEINNKLDEMATDGTLTNLIKDYIDPIFLEYKNSIDDIIDEQNTKINALESGTPLPATSTSDMTDTSKIYVNTTDGKWYYYDGDSWEIGGTYQGIAISDNSVTPEMTTFIDKKENINLFNPETVRTGGFYSSNNTVGNDPSFSSNSAFSCNIVPIKANTAYIVTGVSYDITYYDEDLHYLGKSSISGNVDDRVIPANHAYQAARYIGLSYRHATYPTVTYMTVEGEIMPASYQPYFVPYYLMEDIKIKESEIIPEVYHVGPNRLLTSFTDLIKDLATNTNNKIIYVDSGTYDIFTEFGGSEYALSIEEGSTWKQVNPLIPKNTKIIGLGNVVFSFEPTEEEIGTTAKTLLSPINVVDNVEISNITVIAKNCRYAIHDDGSSDRTRDRSRHIYNNVTAIKTGAGYQQAFGGGIGNGSYYEFNNCKFSSSVYPCFSFHNQWYSLDGIIVINNCVFDNTTQSIRLGSLSTLHENNPILVSINNSYINGPIKLLNEDGNVNRENPYKIKMLNSSSVTIDSTAFPDNPFTPEIYNIQ